MDYCHELCNLPSQLLLGNNTLLFNKNYILYSTLWLVSSKGLGSFARIEKIMIFSTVRLYLFSYHVRGNQHISQSSGFRDPAVQHNVNCYEHTVADNHPHTPQKTLSIFSMYLKRL